MVKKTAGPCPCSLLVSMLTSGVYAHFCGSRVYAHFCGTGFQPVSIKTSHGLPVRAAPKTPSASNRVPGVGCRVPCLHVPASWDG